MCHNFSTIRRVPSKWGSKSTFLGCQGGGGKISMKFVFMGTKQVDCRFLCFLGCRVEKSIIKSIEPVINENLTNNNTINMDKMPVCGG